MAVAGLDDAVLNEGVSSPTIHGQKTSATAGREGITKGNGATQQRVSRSPREKAIKIIYVVISVVHPTPTTKSSWVLQFTETEPPGGEKLTVPPVV